MSAAEFKNRVELAQKHESKSAQAIAQAIDGPPRRYRSLLNAHCQSFDTRLTAACLVNADLPLRRRLGAADLLRIAATLDMRRPSKDTVKVYALPHPNTNDDFRLECDFGFRDRTRHKVVCLALQPAEGQLHPSQFMRRGFGLHKAITAARDRLAEDYRYAVEVDISRCYASFDETGVGEGLPLPTKITRSVLLARYYTYQGGNELTTNLIHAYMHNECVPPVDHIAQKVMAVRRGIPEGSSASPLVCNFLLAPVLRQLPTIAGVTVTNYADNFLVQGKTAQSTEAMVSTLGGALLAHFAGPLRSTNTAMQKNDFEFLGHRLQLSSQGIRIDPCPRNEKRFHSAFHSGLARLAAPDLSGLKKAASVRNLRRYVRSWFAQYKLCDDATEQRAKYLELVTEAVTSSLPKSWLV